MDEREGFEANREAKREAAGKVGRSTRERMWTGLMKYLAVETEHARKAAASDKKDRGQRSS